MVGDCKEISPKKGPNTSALGIILDFIFLLRPDFCWVSCEFCHLLLPKIHNPQKSSPPPLVRCFFNAAEDTPRPKAALCHVLVSHVLHTFSRGLNTLWFPRDGPTEPIRFLKWSEL